MAERVCSECGKPLLDKAPTARTCSRRCRTQRHRRLARINRDIDTSEAVESVQAIVRRDGDAVVRRVLKQELEPVVREAIDESVLRAIDDLVALTPAAVAALRTDLESEDPVMRSRAAALVVKYTIGHPALVKPSDEKHEQLIVNFNLPRPDAVVEEELVTDAANDAVEETRVCDLCGVEKESSEFVAGSDRCRTCFEAYRERILREFT